MEEITKIFIYIHKRTQNSIIMSNKGKVHDEGIERE